MAGFGKSGGRVKTEVWKTETMKEVDTQEEKAVLEGAKMLCMKSYQ